MLGLHILQIDDAAIFQKRRERIDSADLLNRQFRALFARIECAALPGEVMVNRLADALDCVRIGSPTSGSKKLNAPQLYELLRRDFLPHPDFTQRAVELERRDTWVGQPQPKISVAGKRVGFGVWRGVVLMIPALTQMPRTPQP